MHCRSRHESHPVALSAVIAPVDGKIRVGDAEREQAASLLGDAAAGGYLSLDELEGRLHAVWTATTGAELSAACSDVPPELHRARATRRQADHGHAMIRAGLAPHLASYVGVMVLLVLIWLLVGLSGGSWYPWPVWPALGWGVGAVTHLAAAKAI